MNLNESREEKGTEYEFELSWKTTSEPNDYDIKDISPFSLYKTASKHSNFKHNTFPIFQLHMRHKSKTRLINFVAFDVTFSRFSVSFPFYLKP